jgi:hypothetical protein
MVVWMRCLQPRQAMPNADRASTRPLRLPARDFNKIEPDVRPVAAAVLYRVTRHDDSEPYFSRSGGGRFDDPGRVKRRRFGTCYFGFDIAVAFAEAVLHDAELTCGGFDVPACELECRFALRFACARPLKLANLTGTALLLAGGNGELSGTSDYALTQQWSRGGNSSGQGGRFCLYVALRQRLPSSRTFRANTRQRGPTHLEGSCTASPSR